MWEKLKCEEKILGKKKQDLSSEDAYKIEENKNKGETRITVGYSWLQLVTIGYS